MTFLGKSFRPDAMLCYLHAIYLKYMNHVLQTRTSEHEDGAGNAHEAKREVRGGEQAGGVQLARRCASLAFF